MNKLKIFKNFFIISIVAHIIFLAALFLMPEKKNEIITIDLSSIASPDEILKKQVSVDNIVDEKIYDDMIQEKNEKIKELERIEKEKKDIQLKKEQEKQALAASKKEAALKAAEAKKKAEAEKQRIAKEELKKKEEREKKESAIKADEERKKNELLAKEKAKIDKAKEEEKKKQQLIQAKADAEKKQAESIRKEKEYKNSLEEYVSNMTMLFHSNWIIPIHSESNWACKVEIRQNKNGKVDSIKMDKGCPSDPDFLKSIERTIVKSTPLPKPPQNLNFGDIERINLIFKVRF